MPRLAVIGCGRHASRKIYPYLGQVGGQLVGVCDLDAEKARSMALRFGGQAYGDLRSMLQAQRPDGVIICVGPQGHAELAVELLNAHVPVYTEKPPAPDAAGALEVARAARDTGLLCMTGFKKRYATVYQQAHDWLGQFPADDRLALSVDYASGPYPHTEGDDNRPFLLDFAIHVIDLVGYLFGDVDEVGCLSVGDRAYAVNLRFQCGAVGSMSLNDGRSFAIPTEHVELTVTGGHAMTINNSSRYRIMTQGQPAAWREPPIFTSLGDSGDETGHAAELRAFVDYLRDPTHRPPSTIDQSYRSMVLYEAIADAATTRRNVQPRYQEI
jgi:predicted dehydrogenase